MSRNPLILTIIGSLVWLLSGRGSSAAHPLDPALLEIREIRDAPVEVLWRVPLGRPGTPSILPVLPHRCVGLSTPTSSNAGRSVTQRWTVNCGSRSLVGERIGIQGLRERKTDALLRVHLADARVIQAVLRGDNPFLTIPERTSPLSIVHDYLILGFEHILTGPDHLLFLLGLLLLVHGRRLLFWTITSFTVGHSVTLSLAVLGFVHIPPTPVEALIAFSLFVVAVELTREAVDSPSLLRRFPWAMVLAFGLLHGLGFAGALAEIGLPTNEIPLALFSFNVGIELGQLLFVLLILLVRAVLFLLPVRWPKKSEAIPAYVIGSLAVFWILERVLAIRF